MVVLLQKLRMARRARSAVSYGSISGREPYLGESVFKAITFCSLGVTCVGFEIPSWSLFNF